MERVLCWTALGVAGVLLLLFGLDLGIGFPFSAGSAFGIFRIIDIVGSMACALALYLAYSTLREVR